MPSTIVYTHYGYPESGQFGVGEAKYRLDVHEDESFTLRKEGEVLSEHKGREEALDAANADAGMTVNWS